MMRIPSTYKFLLSWNFRIGLSIYYIFVLHFLLYVVINDIRIAKVYSQYQHLCLWFYLFIFIVDLGFFLACIDHQSMHKKMKYENAIIDLIQGISRLLGS